ncbi:toll/interleukin-1 receptor domain-containing protein [candidate division KSB1 bacterium]|nr:toll/interleukin-1 receptor domain-containing protein [candidate division KSB1 bacterium]
MAKLFISFANKDIEFVIFLNQLLNHHFLKSWFSNKNLLAGEKFREKIYQALLEADHLLIVVTANTLKSKWVKEEISFFQKSRPNASIIPLVLDRQVDLNKLAPNLSDYEYIVFSSTNDNEGFKELINRFGSDYLPPKKNRRLKERRNMDENRRDQEIPSNQQQLKEWIFQYVWDEYQQKYHHETYIFISESEIQNIRKSFEILPVDFVCTDREPFCDDYSLKYVVEGITECYLVQTNYFIRYQKTRVNVKDLISNLISRIFNDFKISIDNKREGERREQERRKSQEDLYV